MQPGENCDKCGKRWSGVYQRDADTLMFLCNACGNVVLEPLPSYATEEQIREAFKRPARQT